MRIVLPLALFCFSISALAAEGYKSTISKAQELTLTQERQKVTKILVEALEREPRESKAFKELKKTLLSLSELFYTEKAQRVFEAGRSLEESDIGAAIDKFSEALKMEPGNAKVLKELTRSYLTKGECRKSLDHTKEALLQNPFSTEFFLLRLQSKACLSAIEDYQAELANPFVEKESVGIYLDHVQAQALLSAEQPKSALEILERAKIKDGQFPETYYWIIQAKTKLGVPATAEIEKYVSLCKESMNKLRAKYIYEPRTCRELKTVEKQLETTRSEST